MEHIIVAGCNGEGDEKVEQITKWHIEVSSKINDSMEEFSILANVAGCIPM